MNPKAVAIASLHGARKKMEIEAWHIRAVASWQEQCDMAIRQARADLKEKCQLAKKLREAELREIERGSNLK